MAWQVELFSFAKRENSTARPARGNGLTLTCNALDVFNIERPRLELHITDSQAAIYNYMYIPDLARYYWIVEPTRKGPLWVISGQIDVLASFRSELGASTLYVRRASASFDPDVADALYPMTADVSSDVVTQDPMWDFDNPTIVACIAGTRAMNWVAMTKDQWNNMVGFVTSNEYYDGILGYLGAQNYPELKAMIDPSRYITNVALIPLPIDRVAPDLYVMDGVDIGGYVFTGRGGLPPCIRLTQRVITIQSTIQNWQGLTHPQAADRGRWLNAPPFTEASYMFMPFGAVTFDLRTALDHGAMDYRTYIDVYTGDATVNFAYVAQDGTRTIFAERMGNIGTGVMFGGGYTDRINMWSVLDGAYSAINSALFLDAKGYNAGLQELDRANVLTRVPHMTVSGSVSGISSARVHRGMYLTFHHVAGQMPSNLGRPLMAPRRIDTIPGYVQASSSGLAISGSLEELNALSAKVEGGFFYE